LNSSNLLKIILWAAASLGLGALVAAFSPGSFWMGWLAAGILAGAGLALIYLGWRWAGGGRTLAWIVALAFLLRLGLGIALNQLLPLAGYETSEDNLGYLFTDAWRRDFDAWDLARSGQPLWEAFQNEIVADQYGGLLAISALIYRTLSPDVLRPLLIVILTAWTAALGVTFFWKAVWLRWGAGVALPATWIFALYPEGVVLGSSQMREPFLIAFSALTFWAAINWDNNWRSSLLGIFAGLAGLLLFSSRVAFPIAGLLLIWFWLDHMPKIQNPGWRLAGWIGLALAGAAAVYFGWRWVSGVMDWDSILTFKNSGMVQKRITELGEAWLVPFVTVYGVTRPVLPAVITDIDTVALWRALWVFRSAGWYALAPLLAYGFFQALRVKDRVEQRLMIYIGALAWVWVFISAARAGGDQTDNPRYRTILLVWLALLAGWSWYQSRLQRDPWLVRWLAVEGVFLVFITQWYASRNFHLGPMLNFWVMLVIIGVLSIAILLGGWLHDSLTRKHETI